MMLEVVWFLVSYFCPFLCQRKFTLQYCNCWLCRRRVSKANSVLQHLPELECAIVGEPTLMQLA
jgi:hypothetical protein